MTPEINSPTQNAENCRMNSRVFLLIVGLLVNPATNLLAANSPINSVLDKTKCIVSIESVNAAVASDKPQGILDKATGLILLVQKVLPIVQTRDGSGFIIDPRGIIVTNAHTVEGAGKIAVTLHDGTQLSAVSATVIPNTDIAFLIVQPPGPLQNLLFADSDIAQLDSTVYTIGHSDWLKGTLIEGKISGVVLDNSSGTNHAALLRVTFHLYKGDSGSPILDPNGNFVGMVTAGQIGEPNTTFAIASNVIGLAYQSYLQHLNQKN